MSSALAAIMRRSVKAATPVVQAYAEGNMLVQVRITRPVPITFNRDTGRSERQAGALVYAGAARMYLVSGGATYNLGDEPQEFATSYVSIPVAAQRPQAEDDVEVIDHRDTTLIGRHYRITGVDSGGLIPAVHRCAVTGVEPSPNAV